MAKGGSESGNVDYQLLARRKVSDNLRLLADRGRGVREKKAALRRLIRLRRYTLPYCFETLRKQPGVFDEVIAEVLQALGDPACLYPLSEVMLDPSVPDDTKAALLPVFQFYQVDMESLPWHDVFHDVRRVARKELQRLVLLAAADQSIAQQVLDEMDRLPPEGKAAYARYLGQTGLAQAVPFLAALSCTEDPETVQAALEGLVTIGGLAAWRELLYLTATLPRQSPVRQWAAQAAQECGEKLRQASAAGDRKSRLLETAIVRPELVTGATGGELRLEEAAVSAVDGAGNRAVWLAYGHPAHPRRSWQTIYLLIHDEKGIVLCFGSSSPRRTIFRRLIQELRKDTAVLVGDVEYALTLVRDALWHNRRSRQPLPVSFHYWWRVLGLPAEIPRPYTPRFSASERETAISQVKPADTRRLLDYHEFDDWFLVEPAVYDWIDRFDSLREAGEKAPAQAATVLAGAQDSETVRELLTPGLARWRRRLALMADFYRRAGREHRFRLALATLLRFRPGQVESLPFAVRMIQKSIRLARGNMREGFDPRLLPEAFGIV
ncbi:MAG: HEAT repeat domain-containing protein [Limnochordales bacterium]|nr:HEAT repeat domain-containing protein [Limnochordales bacterium]